MFSFIVLLTIHLNIIFVGLLDLLAAIMVSFWCKGAFQNALCRHATRVNVVVIGQAELFQFYCNSPSLCYQHVWSASAAAPAQLASTKSCSVL